MSKNSHNYNSNDQWLKWKKLRRGTIVPKSRRIISPQRLKMIGIDHNKPIYSLKKKKNHLDQGKDLVATYSF